MNILKLIILFFCAQKAPIIIQKGYIYKSFPIRAGTTANFSVTFTRLENAEFSNKIICNIDTNQINSLNEALKTAKIRRHWQRKIGGFTSAVVLYVDGKKHNCIYIETPQFLIDFTNNKEYIFKKDFKKILKRF